MPFVEFIAGRQLPETVAYQPDGQTTLLELARLEELPLHWRCGLGTCGTCAVRLTLIAGTAPAWLESSGMSLSAADACSIATERSAVNRERAAEAR